MCVHVYARMCVTFKGSCMCVSTCVCIEACTYMVRTEEGIRYPAFSLASFFPGDRLLIESRVILEISKQRGPQSLLPEQ